MQASVRLPLAVGSDLGFCRVLGEQRVGFVLVALFIIGVTWASFGLLTLQIEFAVEEIKPEEGSSAFGSLTVAAGWAAIVISAALLLRLKRPAEGRADTPS